MENSIKKYLNTEQQLERLNYRLGLYADGEENQFEKQIEEINEQINKTKDEFEELVTFVSLENEKADLIRISLITSITYIVNDIIIIKNRGKFPDLQQSLIIPGYIFNHILYSIQKTIQYEGSSPVTSLLNWNNFEWDTQGLEKILKDSVSILSKTKFTTLKNAIDFFYNIAQSIISERQNVVKEKYDS